MGARGSDAALEQAEVVLMNDRLENFRFGANASVRSRRIIYENIIIALGAVVFMMCAASFATHSRSAWQCTKAARSLSC